MPRSPSRSIVASLTLFLAAVGFAASARAQVFYEPVRYQYGAGAGTFYYGGSDPRVFGFAARQSSDDAAQADFSVRRVAVVNRQRVYSDVSPLVNLADNSYTSYRGYTSADARDEASNNVPRYFRKADLLRAAVLIDDGTFVVPAQAKPVIEIRVVHPFGVSPQPETSRGTILIIPKKLLEPKAKAPTVAVAE